jgi:hypothetical protein
MKTMMLQENDKIKILYIGVFLLLCIVAFSILLGPVQRTFHQTDFWWMIPSLSYIHHHNSFWPAVGVLFFNPTLTNCGEPSMNSYLFMINTFLGCKMQDFMFVSAIVHLLCILLFYRLVRRTGFSLRVSFIAVLIYAFSFVHSFYFLWPMSAHHLSTIFFVLLVLVLFLETDYRVEHGKRWRIIFWMTLIANLLASFCQISILVLPVGIFIYILLCSDNSAMRVRRFDLWLPLFITYLGYPLFRQLFWGYPASYQSRYLNVLIKLLSHLPFMRNLTMDMHSLRINPFVLYIFSFMTGLVFLFLLRSLLKFTQKQPTLSFIKKLVFWGAVLYTVLFLITWRLRNIIIPIGVGIPLPDFISPYNLIRPLVSVFISFLSPIHAVLSMNTAAPYAFIPLRSDFIWVVLFILFLIIFFKQAFFKHKELIFFLIIYIFSLPLFTQISLLEMKKAIPSRYFIYITPFFAVIFAYSFSLIYDFFIRTIKISVFKKEMILAGFFLVICLLNISATKLILLKDKFANEFLIYDYIKGATLIQQDLDKGLNKAGMKDICVDGVLPMPFQEYGWDFSPANPEDLDTFKYTIAQASNDTSALDICILSHKGPDKKKEVFAFDKEGVISRNGQIIDPFLKSFNAAKNELKLGNYQQARLLLEQAVKTGSFFFRYYISNWPLEDILWMANGRSAQALISDVSNLYKSWANIRINKVEYITEILNEEMKDYIESFFYLSYLSYLENNFSQSRYWYSRIHFIDDRKDKVLLFLGQQALVKSDTQIQGYMNMIKSDPSYKKRENLRFSTMSIAFKLLFN